MMVLFLQIQVHNAVLYFFRQYFFTAIKLNAYCNKASREILLKLARLKTKKRLVCHTLGFFDPNTQVNSYKVFIIQQSLAATLPPVKLFSQQRYFELGPENLELSYFPHSYAIFPPQLRYFELSYVFWEHIDSVGRGTTVHNVNFY